MISVATQATLAKLVDACEPGSPVAAALTAALQDYALAERAIIENGPRPEIVDDHWMRLAEAEATTFTEIALKAAALLLIFEPWAMVMRHQIGIQPTRDTAGNLLTPATYENIRADVARATEGKK